MNLTGLDHVNIRTANLDAMIGFYETVLGLTNGDRPPFRFGGAWLYIGEMPVVHLVETASAPAAEKPRLEHFAFRAEGLAETEERLRRHGIDYQTELIPGLGRTQFFLSDPDGNHIELQFPPEETPAGGAG